jgi:hypothetical protein
MANYTQSFGYKTYIVPLLAPAVDLADLALDPDTFMPDGTVVDKSSGIQIAGTGASFAMAAASYDFALDGDDNPVLLFGLTDASLDDTTKDEEVVTYDEETKGYETPVATGQGASLKLSGVSDFLDTGYQLMRTIKSETVSEGLMAKIKRVGPAGSNETLYGYGRFMTFGEKNPAGTIVKWDCTFKFYGPARLKLATPITPPAPPAPPEGDDD